MERTLGSAGPGYRIIALAAAFSLGIAAAALDARAAEGDWYMGLQVPVMFIDDTKSDTTGTSLNTQASTFVPYSAEATSEYDAGFKFAGVVGYELGGGLRVEAELFFARAKVDKVTYKGISFGGTPIPIEVDVPISGSAEQFGGFASAWYDFHTGTDWIPYFGAGVGFIRVDQSDLEYDDNTLAQRIADLQAVAQGQQPTPLPDGYVPGISRKDTTFAYHFGVGIGYRLNDKTTLQLGYRLQNASGLEFSGRNATGTVNVDTDLRAHLFEVGFRTRF